MQNTNPFSLQGKRALITGGGTGIGKAIAKAFVEAGADVIIAGRRVEVLQEACKEIGGNIHSIALDVADCAAAGPAIEKIEREHGPLTTLVNNAGINAKKPSIEVTDEEFARIIQANLSGLFALTREFSKKRVAAGEGGSILNITSMAAMYGLPKVAAYTSSKTALLGLTRMLAVEFGQLNIRVNAIAPGFIYSEMTDKALNSDPDRKARVFARTPMNRMGAGQDIALGAVYLSSDAANFVTGVNLPIDGGNSIGF